VASEPIRALTSSVQSWLASPQNPCRSAIGNGRERSWAPIPELALHHKDTGGVLLQNIIGDEVTIETTLVTGRLFSTNIRSNSELPSSHTCEFRSRKADGIGKSGNCGSDDARQPTGCSA
jgi:hypothetical protein